jgi:rhodanese-related sulfurtransferase
MDGEISPAGLAALLAEGAPVRLVDVRSAEAFRAGHIPGSECLPLPSLPDRIETLAGAERVVTVCPHGEASVKAARLIAAYEGIDADTPVESLAGGLAAWEGELHSADGRPADRSNPTDAPF